MVKTIISESITVDAPPEVVFAIVADPRQHSRIDGSGSVGSVISAPERLTATGQTFSVRMKMFGVPYVVRNRVVEFDAGRRIAWRHFAPNLWRYELRPTADGGTTVTETFDASQTNWIITGTLFRAARIPERTRQGLVATLPRLKAVAEADAVHY